MDRKVPQFLQSIYKIDFLMLSIFCITFLRIALLGASILQAPMRRMSFFWSECFHVHALFDFHQTLSRYLGTYAGKKQVYAFLNLVLHIKRFVTRSLGSCTWIWSSIFGSVFQLTILDPNFWIRLCFPLSYFNFTRWISTNHFHSFVQ